MGWEEVSLSRPGALSTKHQQLLLLLLPPLFIPPSLPPSLPPSPPRPYLDFPSVVRHVHKQLGNKHGDERVQDRGKVNRQHVPPIHQLEESGGSCPVGGGGEVVFIGEAARGARQGGGGGIVS